MRRHVAAVKRTVKDLRLRLADLTSSPHPDPVFVLGNQKAGTTAVARLLAHGTGSTYSHDMFFRRRWTDVSDLHTGRLSLEDLVARAPAEFSKQIIKDPDLTFHHAELKSAFPTARFVFVVRDPARNIKSMLERLGLSGEADLSESDLPRSPLWASVFDPVPLHLAGGTPIEVLAQRWALASRICLDASPDLHIVRYEEFSRGKERVISGLADGLGLQWVRGLEGEADRQFQPKGSSRSVAEFFDETSLEHIRLHAGPEAMELGYSEWAC